MPARARWLCWALLAPWLCAAAPGEKGGAADSADLFTGFSVAANATDIFAPESGFRIDGWSSWSGNVKLLELAPDGKEVKAGQMMARFEFMGRDAQRWINEKLQRAEAEAAQAKLGSEQQLDALIIEKRRKELEARLAGINVEKERALSRKQAELYRIAHQVAVFEVDAVDQRLVAVREAKAAGDDYQERAVARAKGSLARYAFYERRFQVNAPHAGVARHAFNPNERRKLQKGDSITSGQRIMSVAKDSALAVKFFVPEHRIGEVAEGAEVTVLSVTSAEEHKAVVKKIDFFPQELGFLTENQNLPNGREKAFQVTADFVDSPTGFSAGAELKVKARAR